MKIETVARRVGQIRQIVDDDEAAHFDEDRLWRNVLEFIATGECPDPTAFAICAIQTRSIEFARWYA